MEFSGNHHSNGSSIPSLVATLHADGKPNTHAIIATNVQHLIAQLETGHSEVLTQYLTTMARFHKYSLGNVLLIASQRPEASTSPESSPGISLAARSRKARRAS